MGPKKAANKSPEPKEAVPAEEQPKSPPKEEKSKSPAKDKTKGKNEEKKGKKNAKADPEPSQEDAGEDGNEEVEVSPKVSPKAGKKAKEEGKKERPLSPSKVKIKYPRVKTRPLSGNRKGFILQARDSSPPVEKPKKVELTKEEEAERIA